MYKHILTPTDGSPLAANGVKTGLKLAKALGARITGLYVVMPYMPLAYGEAGAYYAGPSPQEHKQLSEKAARKALAVVETQARSAGVPCATLFVTASKPWEGILKVARSRKCDAIVMASHGRSGLPGLILGSETQRVLAHSSSGSCHPVAPGAMEPERHTLAKSSRLRALRLHRASNFGRATRDVERLRHLRRSTCALAHGVHARLAIRVEPVTRGTGCQAFDRACVNCPAVQQTIESVDSYMFSML